jgi:hypothetical protein
MKGKNRMNLDQATSDFVKALVNLVRAAIYEAKAEDKAQSTKEVRGAKADKWPKNFSGWLKTLTESDQTSATGQLLKNCSCVCWTPDKVDLLVMPISPNGPAEVTETDIEDVKELLTGELGFNGEITLRPSGNLGVPTEKKVGRPKKTESVASEPEITADQLKSSCVALAQKLGNRDIVLSLLKKFGASRIDEIPKDKYASVLNAIENYQETTTSQGVDANEF